MQNDSPVTQDTVNKTDHDSCFAGFDFITTTTTPDQQIPLFHDNTISTSHETSNTCHSADKKKDAHLYNLHTERGSELSSALSESDMQCFAHLANSKSIDFTNWHDLSIYDTVLIPPRSSPGCSDTKSVTVSEHLQVEQACGSPCLSNTDLWSQQSPLVSHEQPPLSSDACIRQESFTDNCEQQKNDTNNVNHDTDKHSDNPSSLTSSPIVIHDHLSHPSYTYYQTMWWNTYLQQAWIQYVNRLEQENGFLKQQISRYESHIDSINRLFASAAPESSIAPQNQEDLVSNKDKIKDDTATQHATIQDHNSMETKYKADTWKEELILHVFKQITRASPPSLTFCHDSASIQSLVRFHMNRLFDSIHNIELKSFEDDKQKMVTSMDNQEQPNAESNPCKTHSDAQMAQEDASSSSLPSHNDDISQQQQHCSLQLSNVHLERFVLDMDPSQFHVQIKWNKK